ncbi:MAG: cyclase family protein, partial [Bacillota bacterium]
MGYKIIDLSLEMANGVQTMPMDPKFNITQHCSLDDLGYNLSRLTMSTHQSTHLDVPRHFIKEGATVEQIPVQRFVCKCIKINLRHKQAKQPITSEDLSEHEHVIKEGASILLDTGWDEVLPDRKYFSDFPYVSKELADWFAKRQV